MIARGCSGLTAACVLSAAAFLAGCSSTSSTVNNTSNTVSASASASAGKSAVCKSAASLKASITGLKDVNIRANGTSAVSAQVTKIKQDLATLKADTKGEFSVQMTALSDAMRSLGSSLDAAQANLNGGTLAALATAAGSVVTTGTNLVTAVTSTC